MGEKEKGGKRRGEDERGGTVRWREGERKRESTL